MSSATLTDFYQLSMMYAYWRAGKANESAVFEVYFRKCPFNGEFAVMAGTGLVVSFIETLQFNKKDLAFFRKVLPVADDSFFDYLETEVRGDRLKVSAVQEGTLVFPNEPLVRIEGPLPVAQLVETGLLNLLNYPTLVATNAAR